MPSEGGPASFAPSQLAVESDSDPQETQEWLESLTSVVAHVSPQSAYQNTISLERQVPYPGNLDLEQRITGIIRWNALAMVVRANQAHSELGGHLASFASAAEIFEVGFNHFFRGSTPKAPGDLV